MNEKDIIIDIDICLDTIQEPDTVKNTSTDENLVNESRNCKSEKNANKKEKRFSMGAKKPPKPPRPPRGLSLDAADQKLIREISELAMLKRARIERMKALKKMKAAKAAAGGSGSSNGNFIAMVFTILFCVVIIFQGCNPSRILPSNSSVDDIVISPTPIGAREGNIVGVVDQPNISSTNAPASSGFGSHSIMNLSPGLDNKEEAKKSFYIE
ncbi:hypothetical protein CASFOL_021720 [Castilleja foliolosa]|uniref:Uncharacterized protein n=1 Tax=Castilleja foliolosa TaxID=1961234 RepID=A0ABD3CZE8_9LAMI